MYINLNLPLHGVLVILTAEAKVIGDEVIVKGLQHRQPGGLPPIDCSDLLASESYRALVVGLIENKLLAD